MADTQRSPDGGKTHAFDVSRLFAAVPRDYHSWFTCRVSDFYEKSFANECRLLTHAHVLYKSSYVHRKNLILRKPDMCQLTETTVEIMKQMSKNERDGRTYARSQVPCSFSLFTVAVRSLYINVATTIIRQKSLANF